MMKKLFGLILLIILSINLSAQENAAQEEAKRKAEEAKKQRLIKEYKRKAAEEAKQKNQQPPSQKAQTLPGVFDRERRTSGEAREMRPNKSTQDHFKETYYAYLNEYRSVKGRQIGLENPPYPKTFKENDKMGLKSGDEILIPAEYDQIGRLVSSRRLSLKDSKAGAFSFYGELMIPFVYDELKYFAAGSPQDYSVYHPKKDEKNTILKLMAARYVAKSSSKKKFGIIDAFNRLVLPFEYDEVKAFGPPLNYISTVKDGVAAAYDLELNPLISAEAGFDFVGKFNDKPYWSVGKNGKKGIYSDGKILIPIEYVNVLPFFIAWEKNQPFPSYYLAVGEKGQGLLDNAGNIVIPAEYQEIRSTLTPNGYTADFSELPLYLQGRKNDQWTLLDNSGKTLMELNGALVINHLPLPNDKTLFTISLPGDGEKKIEIRDVKGNVKFECANCNFVTNKRSRDFQNIQNQMKAKFPDKTLVATIYSQQQRKFTAAVFDDSSLENVE